MYSAQIKNNEDEHVLENLEEKYAIFKKVKGLTSNLVTLL